MTVHKLSAGDGAHPRSRGEHQAGRLGNTLDLGSSPLARGTPADKRLEIAAYGLIPARAGNTLHARTG